MPAHKLPYKEFIQIYSKVPRMCVDIVVKTDQGIVLAKRDIPPAKGMWHIPGGTILYDESLQGAIKRVAKQELDLAVKVQKLLGVIEYSKGAAVVKSISLVYLVKPISGILKGGKDGRQVNFFKRIPKNIIPEQEKFLKAEFKQLLVKSD